MKSNKSKPRTAYLKTTERRQQYTTVTMEVPRGLQKMMKAEAKKDERTISAWLRGVVKQWFENNTPQQ